MKIIVLAVSFFLFFSCSEKQSSTAPINNYYTFGNAKPTFRIEASTDTGNSVIYVYFSTSNANPVPIFIANGVPANSYQFRGDDDDPNTRLILPHSNTFNFDISVDSRHTTGSMQMPFTPESLKCNGTYVNSYDWNNPDTVSKATTYTLEWKGGTSDGYLVEYEYKNDSDNYQRQAQATTQSKMIVLSFDNQPFILYRLSVSAYNGKSLRDLKIGDAPNITGDYGDGYVSTLSGSIFSYISCK